MPLCQSKSSVVVDEQQEGYKLPTLMDGKVIKEGVFPCLSRGKDSFRLFLTTKELLLQPLTKDSDDRIERFQLHDLFGCHTLKHTKKIEQAGAYLCFYLYPKRGSSGMPGFLSGSSKYRERMPLVFLIQKPGKTFRENLEFASEWKDAALKILRSIYPPHWQHSQTTVSSGKNNGFFSSNGAMMMEESKELSELEIAVSSYNLLQRRYLIILNPKSGKGKSIAIYREKVAPLLHEAGIKAELLVTQSAGHAESFMSSNPLEGIHAVCTVGGDGLLFEVVNGLRSRQDADQYSHLPVGAIAGGSGNGLARSLADYAGESEDYMRHPVLSTSLAVARGRVIPVNLMEAYLNEKKIYSFLSVGWGLLADIDVESEVLRALGEPRFTLWSFLRLANLKTYTAELSYIPSEKSSPPVKINSDFISIFASCQSYLGSELLFAPEATPNDGCIHLTFSKGSVGRVCATQFLLGLSNGSHINVNGVAYERVSEFTLECRGGLRGNLVVDGERVAGEKLTVRLCSEPLQVFCL